MYQIIDRKQDIKRQVALFREFLKSRPPNEFELAMKANRSKPITRKEWAEAERELDAS